MDPNRDISETAGAATFATTQWTVVLEAARADASDSQAAFARLYRDYWRPLYGYVRRRGHAPADAEDITQSFFVALIEKQRLADLRREGGRFRAFLLTGLKNFLANEWDRSQAAKRGGGLVPLSLDEVDGEDRYLARSGDDGPDLAYEREWAFALIDAALRRAEEECRAAGREQFFKAARPHLQGDRGGRPYAEIAAELGLSPGALKVAIHRLRQRYGALLRAEIARTVGTEAEVAEELRYLIEIVGKTP